ncbi:hypothetical protein LOK49_LG12G00638 [Camellia lanceoleosa]|uniref:Uncharacterized protein n=1 Tax=Camellia lanceoleosa TaxID=1840588 RepID=A0ACC0FVU2_9ERIC|nr:hypothetical protein LOK49_LG12G00638 [Camellia lanceoleosa]
MENHGKKVLLTFNGDEISFNIAHHLAKHGCRSHFSLSLSIYICIYVCMYQSNYLFLSLSLCAFWLCVIRLVLMGNECNLRSAADKIRASSNCVDAVEVVGLDMENKRESVFDEAVDKAR